MPRVPATLDYRDCVREGRPLMPGPLIGLTVLDLSWGMPGAVTGLVLSDFGAEVMKLEPPGGDPFRGDPAWHA